MYKEFSFVFLYIAFFGLSDLLIQYLALKSYFQKIIYYLCICLLSLLCYYYFNSQQLFTFVVTF